MDRTDGVRSCSITVHLKQTPKASGAGVVLEACRVGSVNGSDGGIVLDWELGKLDSTRESDSTERVTKKLAGMLFRGESDREKASGDGTGLTVIRERTVTGADGTGVFEDLEEGAWLIHAVDSASYGQIEDTLAAVPCFYLENGSWIGPVYDPHIWLKAVIASGEPEHEPETGRTETVPKTGRTQQQPAPGKGNQERPETSTMITAREEFTQISKGKDTVTENGKPTPETRQSPSTPAVRTLDDTPLSALVCMFLTCALLIVFVMARQRKKCRKEKRSMLLALGVCMLLSGSLVMPAGAEQVMSGDEISQMLEGERKLVFVNEAPEAPCLTVSKEVLNAENGSRAPAGDRFTFRLYLNHERAGSMRYRVFNEEGVELIALTPEGREHLVPASGQDADPVPLRCGKDGSFSLEGGQYALFEDLSTGDLWEVTELFAKNYERVEPMTSETVSGTISRDGNTARFVNRYDPEEAPGDSDGTLEITKLLLWPEEIALPLRGSFPVRILADGMPWRNAEVELSELSGNSSVKRTRTDENGIFLIAGNQRAVLRSIPLGTDLLVEEMDDPDDAFVPSGSMSWKGASGQRVRVTFTNRLADFVVEKNVRPAEDQGRFLFCLVDGEKQPLSQVPYYLAARDGTLETAEPLYTDAQGHFTLSAEQRAVFTGLEEGTRYGVREERILGYRQTIPESPEGYGPLRVKDGIPVLQFENEKTDLRLSLPSAGGRGLAYTLFLAALGLAGCLIAFKNDKKHTL